MMKRQNNMRLPTTRIRKPIDSRQKQLPTMCNQHLRPTRNGSPGEKVYAGRARPPNARTKSPTVSKSNTSDSERRTPAKPSNSNNISTLDTLS